MANLNGNWIPKRRGIVEHYKKMSDRAIVLFDVYLLSCGDHSWVCDLSLRQIKNVLSWGFDKIIKARQELIDLQWIERRDPTRVFIKKFKKFKGLVDNPGLPPFPPLLKQEQSAPKTGAKRSQDRSIYKKNINKKAAMELYSVDNLIKIFLGKFPAASKKLNDYVSKVIYERLDNGYTRHEVFHLLLADRDPTKKIHEVLPKKTKAQIEAENRQTYYLKENKEFEEKLERWEKEKQKELKEKEAALVSEVH